MLIRRIAIALAGLALATASASAAPALWKISDADSAVWIFGSVHMLPPDTDWRSARFDKILSKADRVYFETDISTDAQMRIVPLSFELGFYRDGSLLSEKIGPDLTARLREAADAYFLPMPSLLTMRPWMAATTLSMGPLTSTGYQANLGVEVVLGAELTDERKGYLETPEQQLGFLAGGTEAEQISMLEATLNTLDMLQSDIDAMVASWLAGDPEALGDVFMAQMGDYDDGMVERIIDNRNHDWVVQIERMLEEDEAALLVVGAAHMVGEVSVVRLLEARGFSSERLQ